MSSCRRNVVRIVIGATILAMWSVCALAQTPVAPVPNPCQRPTTSGSVIHQPPALYSHNGVLNVQFSYQTTTDLVGRQLFCFMTPNGLQNPTLHVNPGDTLNVTVTNNTPFNDATDNENPPPAPPPNGDEVFNAPTCGDTIWEAQGPTANGAGFNMSGGSMNIHYHGTNTTPQCHGDNVVKTLVNPGNTFQYNVTFPTNEPPGLYWYHPHVHGLAEVAVQGGAAGALIVDGIQNVQPAVSGLLQRVIMIRDQQLSVPQGESSPGTQGIPQNDLTVNFVSINSTVTNPNTTPPTVSYTPAVIQMDNHQQFWRICNCTSDAPLDLAVQFDGVNQTFQVVGIDAVPVNSQEGRQPPATIPVMHYRIAPAARVEIIVPSPSFTVHTAQLVTQIIYSGPQGDDLPARPLLKIQRVEEIEDDAGVRTVSTGTSAEARERIPAFTGLSTTQQRFSGIEDLPAAIERVVFFEEVEDGSTFFMSTASCAPASDPRCVASGPPQIDVKFDNNNPPAIVTTQGTVELWHIQNHARENHELHQHQIHFKVEAQLNFEKNGDPTFPGNGQQAPAITGQFADMVEVPFCGGPPPASPPQPPACVDANGNPVIPYPQVDAKMDFRGPDIGDFVFHCHILGHEDRGMMAIERVVQSLH
ncbi:MAG TPA: multicopper oxidase domain-containing protein [Candidatus Angelobacter sp.]